MTRLREETAELHGAAESHPFQKSLVAGRLAPAAYAAWLGQMLLVHDVLERRLAELRAARPRFAAVIRDELFQAPRLRADLVRMGGAPDRVEPLAATAAFVERIERIAAAAPDDLPGVLYVLEGSKNGNRFIARALERAAPGTFALGYLDPHGEAQRGLWRQWKLDMEALGFDEREQSRLVAVARETFGAITALSHELAAAS